MILAAALPLRAAAPSAPAAVSKRDHELAAQGLDLLMNGRPDAAIEVFHQIEREDYESPLGYLLDADAVWWKIYYSTGDLIDPDVFDVVSAPETPWDSHFHDLIGVTLVKAQARIEAHQDLARSYLYKGMAYALEGRLSGLRGEVFPTARAAKKMRHYLLLALKTDPALADADLGVGLYNYFVSTLPGIIRALRWLIGMPGGSRTLGLAELATAAKDGELTHAEAEFYLSKDFSRKSEMHLRKALAGFAALAREYPQNGLWKLLEGSTEIRMGQPAQGEALYREVLEMTRGSRSEVNQKLHEAALLALERRHPGEKFE